MKLFALATEPVSEGWWFDFVNKWGNSASVVGFLFSLGAFLWTWFLQRKIRQVAQESVRKVTLAILSTAIEDLLRQLSTVREAASLGQWLRALDWCRNARNGVLRLRGNPHLIDEERNSLNAGADDLTLISQYIESYKRGENVSRNFPKKNREAIDDLEIKISNIQARLGQKSLEV